MTGRRPWMNGAFLIVLYTAAALSLDLRGLPAGEPETLVVRPAAAWQARLFESLRAQGTGGGVGEVFTAQTRFAGEHGENAVLVCWEETVDQGPEGLDIIVNSAVVDHVDALPALWLPACQCRLVTGLGAEGPLPGGDVDGDGTPEEEELLHSFEVVGPRDHLGVQVQKVQESQFFGDALEVTCGFIGASCSGDEENDCEIEVGGDGGAPPPTHFDFSVDGEPRLQVPGDDMAFSDAQCYAFTVDARGHHSIELVAVVERHDPAWKRSGVYLGEPIDVRCESECGEPRRYFVPGVFDGAGDGPSIGSVIFALNRFFGGGNPLPCAAAADANGDARIDVSDLVFVLLHLFSGGHAPFGWRDRNLDGALDATCRSAPVDECLESHAACE